jgi:hypothetical protein
MAQSYSARFQVLAGVWLCGSLPDSPSSGSLEMWNAIGFPKC